MSQTCPARPTRATIATAELGQPIGDPMSRFHDDVPCDFLAYLEWRLGHDRDTTAEMLADWVATYRPQRRREDDDRSPGPPRITR